MPTYLIHGFRWQRISIRIFVIMQNLDDASPDWIIRPASARSLLDTFQTAFDFLPPRVALPSPPSSQSSPLSSIAATSSKVLAAQADYPVRLLEEFDPADLLNVAAPYAYVADYVVSIDRSTSVTDEIAAYQRQEQAASAPATTGWLGRLRDQLQADGEIGWYVVVNGDEQRGWQQDERERERTSRRKKKPQLRRDDLQWPLVAVAQPESESESESGPDSDDDDDDNDDFDSDSDGSDQGRKLALRRLRHDLGGFGSEEGGLGDAGDAGNRQATVVETETKRLAAEARAQRAQRAQRGPPLPIPSTFVPPPPPTLPPPPPPPPHPPTSTVGGQRRRADTASTTATPAARADAAASRPLSSGGFHRLLRPRSRSDARQQHQHQHPQNQNQNHHLQKNPMPPLPPLSPPPNLPLPPTPTPSSLSKPPVRHQKPVEAGALRPKTPTSRSGGSGGGFRRLFGRSKAMVTEDT